MRGEHRKIQKETTYYQKTIFEKKTQCAKTHQDGVTD